MTGALTAVALPIGELDTDPVRSEVQAILTAVQRFAGDLIVADPAPDEAKARQAVLRLSDRNPDLLVLIALRGLSAQAIEAAARTSGVPCLLWPVQGRFALPSSALAAGALHETGFPVELIYAPPDHPASTERLRCVARAARAYSGLKRSRIGIIGGLFPNLVSCRYNLQKLKSRLGIEFLQIPFDEIRASMHDTNDTAHQREPWVQEVVSSSAVRSEDLKALDAGIRLHQALKQIAVEKEIDGFAAECWTGFPRELGLNPCLGFLEDAYTLACEGDVMLCAALLTVRYLTGIHAYVGDLYDLDLDGNLTLVHCGGPASRAANKNEVVLAKSRLAAERGFETMTCRPRLESGPVTLIRLFGLDCNQLHVALGDVSGSETSPDLRVTIRLAGDRWNFLEQCFGNHYIVAPGDIRGELNQLCKWLGITLYET